MRTVVPGTGYDYTAALVIEVLSPDDETFHTESIERVIDWL